MTDYVIKVVVDPTRAVSGSRRVEDGLNRTGNAADKLRRRLQQAFTFAAIGLAVRQIIRMADTLTNLNNRLRLVTRSERELLGVQKQLFDIANRTRSSYQGTAELYARLAIASKELGVGQKDMLQFTESLNQAIIMSGASAVEAQAGLIQLSQGMASGTLRGDELRSVLEQLPAVADVIAKGLGVTRGELRKLGSEGKITARDIIDAFKEARAELAEKFATTIPTVGQAWAVFNNKLLQALGTFDRATGASAGLAKVLMLLANNLDIVAGAVAITAAALVGYFASTAIPAAIAAVTAFGAVLMANPIGLIATAIAIVVVALYIFIQRTREAEGAFGEFSRSVIASVTIVRDAIAAIIQAVSDLKAAVQTLIPSFDGAGERWGKTFDVLKIGIQSVFNPLSNLGAKAEMVARVFSAAIKGVVTTVDFLRASFFASVAAIIAAWRNLPLAFKQAAVAALNGAITIVEAGVNKIIKLIKSIPFVGRAAGVLGLGEVSFGRVEMPEGGAADTFKSTFEQEYGKLSERFNQLKKESSAAQETTEAEEQLTQTRIRGTAASDAAGVSLQKIIQGLDQEAKLLQMSRPEREIQNQLLQIEKQLKRELTDTERQLVESKLRRNQELKTEAQLLEEIRGPMERYKEQIAALNRLLEKGAITTAEFSKKQGELAASVSQGMGFAGEAFKATFDAASNALSEFIRTGEFDFKKFINNLLADLTRLAMNQLFKQMMGGMMGGGGMFGGGGGGGLLGGLLGFDKGGTVFVGANDNRLPGFANGGSVTVGGRPGTDNNVLSLNGRPVARVSRGEQVDVSNKGGGGHATTVVMNIQTPDADSFKRSQGQIMARTQFAMDRAQRRNG